MTEITDIIPFMKDGWVAMDKIRIAKQSMTIVLN